MPLGSSIEGKQKGFLEATGNNTASLCAISRKNQWVLKILPVPFFVIIVSCNLILITTKTGLAEFQVCGKFHGWAASFKQ